MCNTLGDVSAKEKNQASKGVNNVGWELTQGTHGNLH